MTNKIFFFVLVLVLFASAGGIAATKIDPTFNYMKFTERTAPLMGLAAKAVSIKSVGGKMLVGCIIRANDLDAVADAVQKLGGTVKTKLKTVMTADVPPDALSKLAALKDVVYIEAAKKVSSKMNYARGENISNVVQVQDGTGTTAYNGSGSVVGIVDTGVDCTHADFKDSNGLTRIVAFWDMETNHKYLESEIENGDCSDSGFHGTHVSGIAAGSDATYKGVAPQASIAVAQLSSNAGEDEVLDGIEYIFQQAQLILAPAVANLSIGTSIGPHDGTSTFETGVDEVISGKTGRAVVCAAGNETVNTNDTQAGFTLGGLHAAVNVAAESAVGYETIIRSASSSGSFVVDVWLSAGGDCTVELDVFSGGTKILDMSAISPGGDNSSDPANTDNIYAYVDFTDNVNANNGKQHAQVAMLYTSTSPRDPEGLTYDLIFRSAGTTGCAGHAWLYPDMVATNVFTDRDGQAGDGYTYSKGDSVSMITVPATSTGCITVASFASRGTWVGKEGEKHQDVYDTSIDATGTPSEDLSLFSSHGPGVGASNAQKPDITAPGEPILSTLASTVSASDVLVAPDDKHVKLEGTSMSSPLAAGIVALLFEKNGCLTPSEVKTALTSNVITDSYTGSSLPDYEWGYGKVDALAAINSVTASDCQPDNPSDDPSTGGTNTCSLMRNAGISGPAYVAGILILLLLAVIFIKRATIRKLRG